MITGTGSCKNLNDRKVMALLPSTVPTGVAACPGEKRIFPFLFASVFPTSEYRGNTLENIKGKMDQTTELREYRLSFLHHQQHGSGCGVR
jgi:hypothetical protein